jgi:hypothetical protein
MSGKKHTYNSSVLALPSLKVVLGDVPNPEGESRHAQANTARFRPFGAEKLEAETRSTLQKLIGHIQETK